MNDAAQLPTVADALREARQRGVDRLDAELLLASELSLSRSALIARGNQPLLPELSARWRLQIGRRADGVPLAYLLGEKEFHSLLLRVSPSVLVPRPETELLVEWALEILAARRQTWPTPAVADLGTGSGAIALAIVKGCPQAQAWASDISAAALDIARENARRLGLQIRWLEGSWWQPFGGVSFDLAVANPPYIEAADPHLAALRHEPLIALTPGPDGLSALRDIITGAPPHLHDDGWLLLEHGFDQGAAVQSMLRRNGWQDVSGRNDLAGLPRASGGRRPRR